LVYYIGLEIEDIVLERALSVKWYLYKNRSWMYELLIEIKDKNKNIKRYIRKFYNNDNIIL